MPSFKTFAQFQKKAQEAQQAGAASEEKEAAATPAAAVPAAAAPAPAVAAPKPAAPKPAAPKPAAPKPAAPKPAAPKPAASPPKADAPAAPAAGDAKAASPDGSGLCLGMRIQVVRLQARPELNGLVGKIVSFDEERSRWQIELDNGGGQKLFKANNLEPTDQEAPSPPATGSATPSSPASPSGAATGQPKSGYPSSDVAAVPKATVARSKAADEFPDDDEGFVQGIEQCLKESDIMWDDY
eukprot:gnl/TRDRNA2_/TRDRNA2_42784_c0_seq1.p1 gnl/TRDRNA2_/TRDRNA2_42784_c0~~gnl/TRDRNA2_/TRDRNA2_42784_c0_seq1.p1  ORF type:complete len:260 (-),score=67.53 gnl/TRDRNA2_/TRDRNA2_42784_c0_seq1:127-849(-)